MDKSKYWIAIGGHPHFTRDDNHIMYVYPWGHVGSGQPLMSKFFEADDIESVRDKLHAFVDEHINHEIHMRGLVKKVDENKVKREQFKSSRVIPDEDINQLTIGEFVGDNPKAARSDTEGVLNLEDLL